MPIPALDEDGFLPPGVHVCTTEELRRRFGTFQGSDRRPRLFARFLGFVEAIRKADIFTAIVVDGSFVTDKPAPNDIDLVLVLAADHDFEADLRPSQYSLVVPAFIRRQWGFDAVVAVENTPAYRAAISFFQMARGHPSRTKGVLRIAL
jgi:hypothetical protein